MREIKFRAFDTDFDGECFFPDFSISDGEIKHKSKTLKIMQFTGLKDKNGKEIYEGDIIVCRDGKAVIIYIDSFAKFVMDFELFGKNTLPDFQDDKRFNNIQDADMCMRSIEVIGNIYENTELLSSKKGFQKDGGK